MYKGFFAAKLRFFMALLLQDALAIIQSADRASKKLHFNKYIFNWVPA
jgi:hypothetical protein